MNLLRVSGISKQSGNDFVLKEISFRQQPLQKIAIAGETGSGKSTLLKIIAGLIQPDSGEVQLENERVLGLEEKLLPGHPGIAYLSQHFELRNNYRVDEILEMANKMPDEEAQTVYRVCRIDRLLKRRTNELSGGEKQRIATARLLIGYPKLLLLDEPYSNLDIVHKRVLKSVIHDIGSKLKITCILVSHDPADTLSWADEIIVIKDGQLVQQASPQQIYRQPVDEYVAGLFGTYNLLSSSDSLLLSGPAAINNKRLFIRPEEFEIISSGSATLKASVKRVSFFGSYYEIEALLHGNVITVKTVKNDIKEGEAVYLSFPAEPLWYI